MKALLFFIGGNIMALLYFYHLYLQLTTLQKSRKHLLLGMFPLRFLLLSTLLGTLCFFYPAMTLYMVAGLLSGRVAVFYLVRRKWL